MHGNLPAQAQRAIFPADQSVAEYCDHEIADQSVGESSDWFARLARFLSPKKPSATLAYLLGDIEDRTHQRWAAGREPKAGILVKLLHSSEGGRVLSFIMRGSKSQWWLDHCRAAADAAILRSAIAERERQLDLFQK